MSFFAAFRSSRAVSGDTESLTSVVRAIDALYGPKKDLLLMDNNVVASPRFKEIIAEIRDLGFTPRGQVEARGHATGTAPGRLQSRC